MHRQKYLASRCRTKVLFVNFLHVKNVNGLDIYLDNGDKISFITEKAKRMETGACNLFIRALRTSKKGGYSVMSADF